MLNLLWAVMILTGLVWGALQGNLDAVTEGFLVTAKDAVELSLTMLGVMSFWCGILEIGSRAGLIEWLTKKLGPVLDFLFPTLERNHPAREPIAVNMAANMLGLGMAATPAGLKAMRLMKEVPSAAGTSGGGRDPGRATDAMCTFLILNISSLQLVPVTMIAYRSQYGSAHPTAVLGPALAATACSTLTAVAFCKIMDAGKAVRKR